MNELQIINISGVDCYEKDGTAYLKLDTVARGLGFTRIADSGNEVIRWERVNRYLNELNYVPTSGHDGFIPENIFYRLAMKAKNPVAEAFQAKVADEIIPRIRKTGGYILGEENMTDDEIMASALIVANRKLEERAARIKSLEDKIALDAPKVEFHDMVADATNCIYVSELAKLLHQNGLKIGRDGLFELLRKEGYLLVAPGQWNKPSQYAMNLGLFKVVERVVDKNGYKNIQSTTFVTPKGIKYFMKRYLIDGKAGQPVMISVVLD